jgi:hypothetical protein
MITLAGLHDVIQAALAWWDYHLHQYIVDGQHYGTPDGEFEDELPPTIDEHTVTLRDIVDAKEIVYEYDFGDSWEHRVEIESVSVAADPVASTGLGVAKSLPDAGENLHRVVRFVEVEGNEELQRLAR